MAAGVAKVIEITAASTKGIEDAVQTGLKKVGKTVKNIKGAWVNDINVVVGDDGKVAEWRVNMRITFLIN
ncbi:MAG: dodecin domain-containing protein [Lysobacterales bacterium CG02_land_8_20_14_3_00_62_12]|nr:MAG: dodecin domain-containing protein [Xanthomonadales bacterium CG02_land_8_20_14_3_00_62_12]PJA41655.1 MAG: dodecin domain-containing protein [Xanthomonadales bacterium CG_4_9_14_3_um_filter_62_6]